MKPSMSGHETALEKRQGGQNAWEVVIVLRRVTRDVSCLAKQDSKKRAWDAGLGVLAS